MRASYNDRCLRNEVFRRQLFSTVEPWCVYCMRLVADVLRSRVPLSCLEMARDAHYDAMCERKVCIVTVRTCAMLRLGRGRCWAKREAVKAMFVLRVRCGETRRPED